MGYVVVYMYCMYKQYEYLLYVCAYVCINNTDDFIFACTKKCMYACKYLNMTLYVQVLEKMIEKLARIVKHVLPGASDLALDSQVDAATATWLNESYSGASPTDIHTV